MKGILKRTVSLLACCALLLTSCGTASKSSLPSELIMQNNPGSLIRFDLLAPSFFMYTDADNSTLEKEAWLDNIYMKYGVRMNVISDTYFLKDKKRNSEASLQRYKLLNGKSSFKGAVAINASQLYTAIDQELALPLDSYLADNPIWNSLPNYMKSRFNVGGQIFAIPASYSRTLNARSFSDAALALTGVTVTDLDSLKEFALAYKEKTGNCGLSTDGLTNLVDILNAFGLYTDQDAALPFAYDPVANCVADFLTKDEAVTALEYLRELYQAGALKINFDSSVKTAPGDFESGVCASYYGEYYDYSDCTELVTLNPSNPIMYFENVEGYFLTKDTPQPKETVTLLVEMLFGNEQNYLESWLGISGNYTVNNNGTITVEKVRNSDGTYVNPAMPNLVRNLPDVFPNSQADLLFSQNGVVTEEQTGAGEFPEPYKQLIETNKIMQAYDIWSYGRRTFYSQSNLTEITRLYNTCIHDAITDNSRTVTQIIDEYKESMKNLGGNTIIEVMNSSVHKHGAFYYW